MGNLTRELELRFTPSGVATATSGVAVNKRWQNRQTNEWEESTSFYDIVIWRELAEHAAQSLSKGARVVVIGRLEQRSWETADGEKRYKIEIVVDSNGGGIGPDLTYATAEVRRMEKAHSDPGSQSTSASYKPPPLAEPPEWDTDEEPF